MEPIEHPSGHDFATIIVIYAWGRKGWIGLLAQWLLKINMKRKKSTFSHLKVVFQTALHPYSKCSWAVAFFWNFSQLQHCTLTTSTCHRTQNTLIWKWLHQLRLNFAEEGNGLHSSALGLLPCTLTVDNLCLFLNPSNDWCVMAWKGDYALLTKDTKI